MTIAEVLRPHHPCRDATRRGHTRDVLPQSTRIPGRLDKRHLATIVRQRGLTAVGVVAVLAINVCPFPCTRSSLWPLCLNVQSGGAIDPLPPRRRQVLGFHPPREVAEPDHVEPVVRVSPLDQRMQRERHLLRVDEMPPKRHRERNVEKQRGGGFGPMLGLHELEVLRRKRDRPPGSGP